MDNLTFITKMAETLAWPICVIILALLFRGQVVELLRRIVKGKIPGGEFEFSKFVFSEVAKEQIENRESHSPRPHQKMIILISLKRFLLIPLTPSWI